jgi:hypothetical protein
MIGAAQANAQLIAHWRAVINAAMFLGMQLSITLN